MTFPSQFSLSLELTRLIPLTLGIAGKTYEAAMNLARDLRNSGSDIVVEEDIAELFGRARIVFEVESSFKNIVSRDGKLEDLHGTISLHQGPGPTVTRAMTEPGYLSTIIQCSFLVAMHESSSLADSISRYLEKLMEDSLENFTRRANPDAIGIRGMLRACEDQTETYDWRSQILAVAALMDLDAYAIVETIPQTVFHGLISMLPLVQRFPEDRCIIIDTSRGVCNIVTWAHTLLGLPVLVRFHEISGTREVRFPKDSPKGREVVFINVHPPLEDVHELDDDVLSTSSITLLAAVSRDILFQLRADSDDDEYAIDATQRGPLQGVAKRILQLNTKGFPRKDRIIQEMITMICSFSICAGHHLCVDTMTEMDLNEVRDQYDVERKDRSIIPHHIPPDDVLNVAQILFDMDERSLPRQSIEDYTSMYKGQGFLEATKHPPKWLDALLSEDKLSIEMKREVWKMHQAAILDLSLLLLAFAQVIDLDSCVSLPICQRYKAGGALTKSIRDWSGISPLVMKETLWIQLISTAMTGRIGTHTESEQFALFSHRGWSIFVNTFGDLDPSRIDTGKIAIKRGVPWRNGVWSHWVRDGSAGAELKSTGCQRIASSGDTITLSCATRVMAGNPMIGFRDDCLLVALRFYSDTSLPAIKKSKYELQKTSRQPMEISRTGYGELWLVLWKAHKTGPCNHYVDLEQTVQLGPGMCALQNFEYMRHEGASNGLNICMTAGNTAARWCALISVVTEDLLDDTVIIRDPDCCLDCAVTRSVVLEGTVCLIL